MSPANPASPARPRSRWAALLKTRELSTLFILLAEIAFFAWYLYPDGGDVSRATFWCGLRPMTPDGPPLIGPTRFKNLWLNTGHGTLGWTMACGSGHVLADLMAGRAPAIDARALAMERYA